MHGVILSSATAGTVSLATRQASLSAIDALEGDRTFMRANCDCQAGVKTKNVNSDVGLAGADT